MTIEIVRPGADAKEAVQAGQQFVGSAGDHFKIAGEEVAGFEFRSPGAQQFDIGGEAALSAGAEKAGVFGGANFGRPAAGFSQQIFTGVRPGAVNRIAQHQHGFEIGIDGAQFADGFGCEERICRGGFATHRGPVKFAAAAQAVPVAFEAMAESLGQMTVEEVVEALALVVGMIGPVEGGEIVGLFSPGQKDLRVFFEIVINPGGASPLGAEDEEIREEIEGGGFGIPHPQLSPETLAGLIAGGDCVRGIHEREMREAVGQIAAGSGRIWSIPTPVA